MKISRKYNYNIATDRNIGIITKHQQKLISRQKIAIAGCGAEGGSLAVNLARLGVKCFQIADPKIYDLYDLNRQNCIFNDIGKNKCGIIKDSILDINPLAVATSFPKGINKENIDDFIGDSDIVIDALDYENPDLSVLLAKKCREKNLYLFSGVSVGFGCNVFIFDPNSKFTMEKFLNLSPFPWVPKLPYYLDENLLSDVISGKKSAPVIVCGVLAMTSFMISQIIEYIGGGKVHTVPNYLTLDSKVLRIEKRNVLKDLRRQQN